VEIVSVLIEEIHPPPGAAAAYHAVQAAEINASASISDERGRAERVAGVAQQEAHQLTAAADARAVESIDVANADAYRFNAERRAHAEQGQAFLLERSFTKLEAALARKPLLLVDHRLDAAHAPILDLRPSEGVANPAPGPGQTPAGTVIPGNTAVPGSSGAAGVAVDAPVGGAQSSPGSLVPGTDDTY
ncbi:MAG: hypothetical protein ACRETD_10880, partial [Steroidobacteraceae bacterium]